MKKTIFSSLLAVLLFNLCTTVAYAQDDKVYDHVSLKNPPSYPGGIQKFYEWLGGTMKYPVLAAENNVQGTTNVTFTIEKDGSVTDVKTEGHKIGYGTDEEAVRVLKAAKKWNPGSINGKPVRAKYNLPIKFVLPNKSKSTKTAVQKDDLNASTSQTNATVTQSGDQTIYSHVSLETPPTYPGGIAKFYESLTTSITYPKAAADKKIQGIVPVTFIIEKDGTLTDIKTEGRELGGGLEEEAIRVMKLSKRWNPGMQNGKVVRVQYHVPIKFTMKK